MFFSKNNYIPTYSIAITTLFLAVFLTALSAPPGSVYTPGETLEPNCAPGDVNCSVIPPAKSGVNDDIVEIVGLTTPLSTDQGGSGTSTIFSQGTILFTENASGTFAGDNTNLFWDDTNDRLGIGTTTPTDDLTVDGRVGVVHLKGVGETPSIAAGGALGTGPSVSILGTDVAGRVTVTVGALPVSSATILTVTFAAAYEVAPFIIFSPANENAAALSALTDVVPNSTTNNFQLDLGGIAMTAGQVYEWNYFAIQ